MLRVGLTGELGSGKSTVARLLASYGAIVLSSDEMARAMMQPGHPVYAAIVDRFGPGVVLPDGQLNRPELARLAFDPAHPRVDELNAIIHPAVLAEQEKQVAEIARTRPDAIVIIESALIFTTKHAGEQPWRKRFDCVIVVTAPDQLKISRFVQRRAGARELTPAELREVHTDARNRLTEQRIPENALAEFWVQNDSGMDDLRRKLEPVWNELQKLKTRRLETQD